MSLKSLPEEQLNALLSLSAPELRQTVESMISKPLVKPEPIDFPAKIEDSSFKGPESDIPIRIYTPEGTGPFPAVVYYHGGGWFMGGIETHDGICRYLCVSTGTVVISVEYRLVPEARFPAIPEDCYAAFVYNIDSKRIAVAGDSAGGNLSAVVSIMSRDRQGPKPIFQCLVYPVCDMTAMGPYKASDPSDVLPLSLWNYIRNGYLNDPEAALNPLASPMKADLKGLPPALLLIGDKDLFVEECADYVSKLEASGVQCEYICAKGMEHGFFHEDRRQFPIIQSYQETVFAAIKKALF
ncbi:Alpha/Beta hydrolase protein [Umbelopsis sp. PMI_123]|nr:Alpha/Beta hydrolase protein [Umbelopsis sp. PMI_123]